MPKKLVVAIVSFPLIIGLLTAAILVVLGINQVLAPALAADSLGSVGLVVVRLACWLSLTYGVVVLLGKHCADALGVIWELAAQAREEKDDLRARQLWEREIRLAARGIYLVPYHTYYGMGEMAHTVETCALELERRHRVSPTTAMAIATEVWAQINAPTSKVSGKGGHAATHGRMN